MKHKNKCRLILQNTVIVLAVIGVFGFFVWTASDRLSERKPETYRIDIDTIGTYMTSHAAGGDQL